MRGGCVGALVAFCLLVARSTSAQGSESGMRLDYRRAPEVAAICPDEEGFLHLVGIFAKGENPFAADGAYTVRVAFARRGALYRATVSVVWPDGTEPAPPEEHVARECAHVALDAASTAYLVAAPLPEPPPVAQAPVATQPNESCAPAPPEGFVLCLSVAGQGYECPVDYPRAFVLFDTADDSRACSPCECSDPEGADCAALVSVFTDADCGSLLGSFPVSNAMEYSCHDVLPGTALGSKSATWLTDEPGTCTATGSQLIGQVQPSGPLTLCCQPDPEPAK